MFYFKSRFNNIKVYENVFTAFQNGDLSVVCLGKYLMIIILPDYMYYSRTFLIKYYLYCVV